ncbi:hypothetical protein W075_04059 [Mycobacterium tuberculosis TB_RSA165]|uniref:PPE family protein, SVP subgroup n=1 Tax=Mycobacterium tuberculosis TaxID=1773 RepID=UPI00045A2CC6|nr:hypothetical protein W075_04059 [Mycobacterium tuberculosis TB_RSA165]
MTINNQFDDADTHGATSDFWCDAEWAGLRGPVAAGLGRAALVGYLSVPQGWTGQPGQPGRRDRSRAKPGVGLAADAGHRRRRGGRGPAKPRVGLAADRGNRRRRKR